MPDGIEGQLNAAERTLLRAAVLEPKVPPAIVLEVGTWLGGGSTLTFLKALEERGHGRLFGIECDRSIYDQMIANISKGAPQAVHRFTPLFGFSQQVIPQWLAEQPADFKIDIAFLDGGNNPMEQIDEFKLIDARMPVGSHLFSHDAKLRKGRWLVPFVSHLDNWKSQVHDISHEGLFAAVKIAPAPSEATLRAATAELRRLRMAPAEVLGRIAGPGIRKLASRILPGKLVRRLAEGQPG
ncbi:MAG TPA: class I SAM-dependent methyltransferase [Verrucomicrobiae bacterium]